MVTEATQGHGGKCQHTMPEKFFQTYAGTQKSLKVFDGMMAKRLAPGRGILPCPPFAGAVCTRSQIRDLATRYANITLEEDVHGGVKRGPETDNIAQRDRDRDRDRDTCPAHTRHAQSVLPAPARTPLYLWLSRSVYVCAYMCAYLSAYVYGEGGGVCQHLLELIHIDLSALVLIEEAEHALDASDALRELDCLRRVL